MAERKTTEELQALVDKRIPEESPWGALPEPSSVREATAEDPWGVEDLLTRETEKGQKTTGFSPADRDRSKLHQALEDREAEWLREWTGGGGFKYRALFSGDIEVTHPKTGKVVKVAPGTKTHADIIAEYQREGDLSHVDWGKTQRKEPAPQRKEPAPEPHPSRGASDSWDRFMRQYGEPAPQGTSRKEPWPASGREEADEDAHEAATLADIVMSQPNPATRNSREAARAVAGWYHDRGPEVAGTKEDEESAEAARIAGDVIQADPSTYRGQVAIEGAQDWYGGRKRDQDAQEAAVLADTVMAQPNPATRRSRAVSQAIADWYRSRKKRGAR